MELLFERDDLPKHPLPATLAKRYAGELGFPARHTYANFVASLDGVVSLPGNAESGQLVSGSNDDDRFVMALLRAFADAVVIGAETFRRAAGAFWHSRDACPELADEFAELRRMQGKRPEPLLVVVSATAQLDLGQPALQGAWIATTDKAARELRAGPANVVAFEPDRVPLPALLERLRAEGFERLLTEGGPMLFGELVNEGLVDELFLTSSPRLFGRAEGDGKKSLVDSVDLRDQALELRSLRRAASHLFSRYSIVLKERQVAP
jgi:riboflavin biosynthesis pyrimidine reductase